jgi:hypothetical protein
VRGAVKDVARGQAQGRFPAHVDPELSAKGKNHAIWLETLGEDFESGEQIQRGNRIPANTHFRVARFEDALTDWRRQLDALLE